MTGRWVWCALALWAGEAIAQTPSLVPQGYPLAIGPAGAILGGAPAIAFDGGNFFVAWQTSAGEIAGGRVTTGGVLLDPSGIALGTGSGTPSVAFDGANFLVVWADGSDLWGTRVTPGGVVLDAPVLRLTTGANVLIRPTGIAFGDTTYLIAWREGNNTLYSARISMSGINLDGPRGLPVGRGFYPWVQFDGTNFFVVWYYNSDNGNGLDVFGNRISQDGTPLDSFGFAIATDAEDQQHPTVAFDGTNYLVAWSDARGGDDFFGYNDGTARAVRVSPAGAVLDDPAIVVADNARGPGPVVAAFDGTNFIVAWMVDIPAKSRGPDQFGRRIAGNGTFVDPLPTPLATAYAQQFEPTTGAGNNAYFVVWVDRLNAGRCYDGCLYGQVLGQGAALPDPFTSTSAPVPADWQPADSPTPRALDAIWAIERNSVFAVGEQSVLLRYDGTAWQLLAQPDGRLHGVWGARDDDVWATGFGWTVFHYDGQTFTGQGCGPGPFETMALGMWGASNDQILAVGANGGFARYYGAGPMCAGPTGVEWTLFDVWGTSVADAYAVGEFGTILRYDGANWTTIPNIPTLQSLNGIWGSGPTDIFAVGDFGTIVHYDGAAWTLQPGGTTQHLFGVWGYDPSHVYAVGFNGTVLRYDGTTWHAEMSGTGAHLLDVGGSDGDVWAVGDGGTIIGKSVLAVSLSTSGRLDTLALGSAPRPDSADVLLTGPGATGAGWSATHGSATWLTLTTSGGMGSGTVRWSRDPSGLAAGSYIDTITVTAAGAVGSPTRLMDTLVVEPAIVLAVSPGSRYDSVAQGTNTPHADSATITLTGFDAAAAAWSATHGSAATWVSVTTATGSGSGVLRWSRDPSGLAVGTHVDTITVTVVGAVGSPARVVDTLVVEPVLALVLSPGSRRDSVAEGTFTSRPDSATVTLAGFGAAAAGWSAAHGSATWVTLTTNAGTGSGTVRWARDPSGLAAGTYLDTIVVTAAGAVGSPAPLVDTLIVEPALTLALSPESRRDSVAEGTSTPRPDSATVTLTGLGDAAAAWSAAHESATWVSLTTDAGTGSGVLRWSRDPSGLAVGTYVDTITVTVAGAVGSPARVVDTLVVEPVLALALSAGSHRDSVAEGTDTPRPDSATVTVTGFGAAAEGWSAAHGSATWVSLTTDAGSGSGVLRWSRDPSGLTVGTYVDTITVTVAGAVGSPARVVDTLVVEPGLALVLSPGSRRDSVVQGASTLRADLATVTLTGFGAVGAAWSATHGSVAAWVTLTTSADTGSGTLRWSRDPSGLAVGTYIDSLCVTVAGAMGSPARLADTLIVAQALTLVTDPGTRRDTTFAGLTGTRADSATVNFSGDGAASAAWSAAHRAAGTWVTLTTSAGTGSGVVRWTRSHGGLTEGTYVDSIVITAVGAAGSPALVVDSLVIQPPPVTSLVVVDAILEGNALTQEQITYLDQLGNHNGRFDLGDFLAWALQHPDQVNVSEVFPRFPRAGAPVRRVIRKR